MRNTVRAIFSFAVIFFAVLSLFLSGCKGKVYPNLHGTWVAPPVQLDEFALQTNAGPVPSSSWQGKVVVLVFGYAHCPDACPTTMARMAKAMQLLDDAAKNVQVVLISVDPDRDTPALLEQYAQSFNPAFIAGILNEVDQTPLYQSLGIFVERTAATSTSATDDAAAHSKDYLVDHTTSIAVLDRAGAWQLVWNFEVTAEEIATDLRTLVER